MSFASVGKSSRTLSASCAAPSGLLCSRTWSFVSWSRCSSVRTNRYSRVGPPAINRTLFLRSTISTSCDFSLSWSSRSSAAPSMLMTYRRRPISSGVTWNSTVETSPSGPSATICSPSFAGTTCSSSTASAGCDKSLTVSPLPDIPYAWMNPRIVNMSPGYTLAGASISTTRAFVGRWELPTPTRWIGMVAS